MKKPIITLLILLLSPVAYTADMPERYVHNVEKISTEYSQSMKSFLRHLDPKLTEFDVQQQGQFCQIISKYVDEMYAVTDQNRSHLPLSYASVSKQDIIQKVMHSPEMQILQKYNIQCDLK